MVIFQLKFFSFLTMLCQVLFIFQSILPILKMISKCFIYRKGALYFLCLLVFTVSNNWYSASKFSVFLCKNLSLV